MSINDIIAQRKQEWKKQQVETWDESVPPALKGFDIDKLIKSKWNGKLSATSTQKFSNYLKNPTKFLILQGASGLGKTVMGVEVCKRFLEEGRVHTALYADASTVLSELSYHDKGDNPIVKYSRPDILLLDDVGALSTEMTAVRKTGLGAIINQRWLNGKYTIMSTNLSVATQEGSNAFTLHEYLGETSWDRVLSSHLLLSFAGDSMRRKNIPRAAQPQESHTTKRRRRR